MKHRSGIKHDVTLTRLVESCGGKIALSVSAPHDFLIPYFLFHPPVFPSPRPMTAASSCACLRGNPAHIHAYSKPINIY